MTKIDQSDGTSAIHDLTECFRTAKWIGKPADDAGLFDEKIRQMHRGVYVHYLENNHAHPVHDRNGERLGNGKLLIRPHLVTIKFGKFEGGLIPRRSQDAKHMHRRAPSTLESSWGPSPLTFRECLKLALVLDLTGRDKSEIRNAERHLRTQMRAFLKDQLVSVQDHRGDYRILVDPAPATLAAMLNRWARCEFEAILRWIREGRRPSR